MPGVSMISQFPTNFVSLTSAVSKPSSKTSMLPANLIRFPANSKACFTGGVRKKKVGLTNLRAGVDDGFAPESNAVVVGEEPTDVGSLKKQLVDAFSGTNLGLTATSETRAEILELITQLEVLNPTPEPTKALTLLNGKWILAYTSFVGLYPLLSSGTLHPVKVQEISQTIDSEKFTVQNSVVFAGPGSTTAISTNATFEIRSPKRVQIKFDEGIIGTPQLTHSIEIPETIEILGHEIDLTPFKGLITSVEDTASQVAKTISSQPPLKFPISEDVESWLLTTYLDEDVRISRGDGGKVFVLFKEGSSLLSS
ncbi:light-induced protein, chloroplastic-like [Bidens hawaiensis]|uniref:light-induced protein, chloroplastic-like n=1 Tax=Bidens hawaiensis TaxID=980011 RepID=UPI00404A00DD